MSVIKIPKSTTHVEIVFYDLSRAGSIQHKIIILGKKKKIVLEKSKK